MLEDSGKSKKQIVGQNSRSKEMHQPVVLLGFEEVPLDKAEEMLNAVIADIQSPLKKPKDFVAELESLKVWLETRIESTRDSVRFASTDDLRSEH